MSALREILAVFGSEFDDKGIKDGEKGIAGFKQTLGEFGGILAGAFAVHKIVDFGREVLQQADVLAKQSQALSVSTAELQGWQWAAQLSGSSAEQFTGAFTKFNKNVAAAAAGTGPAADALKALGVSIKDSTGKVGAPIELLDGIADGIVGLEDPAKRTEAMMALFGKSGAQLLPLFLEGAEGVKKLRGEVDALGMTFDEAFLEDAQEVNDNLDRLELGFKGLGVQALKPLLPLITEYSKVSVELIKDLIDLLKHSNALKVGLMVFGSVAAIKATSAMVQLAQKAGFLKNGLRGVLLELIPLTLAFLALEDVWTFFSGGESETEGLLNRLFGPDAAAKVKFFADTLKNDIGPIFSDIFAIFTDGKPLDQKLAELDKYISGTLKPQIKADFGEMADSAMKLVEAARAVATAIHDIAIAWESIQELRKSGVGLLSAESQDIVLNDSAKNDAILRGKPEKRATAEDFKGGWVKQAVSFITGFDPQAAADAINKGIDQKNAARGKAAAQFVEPLQVLAQQNVASAPLSTAPPPPPVVNQSLVQNVTQNITAETPAELKRATRDGAKTGLTEGGEYLRTQRALVPSP